MSSHHDEKLLLLLEQHDNDVAIASEELINNLLRDGGRGVYREIMAYVLALGLFKIRSMHRQATRRHIKDKELASVTSMDKKKSVDRYQRARKAIQKRTLNLLATWMIGETQLGDMNKAGLLRSAHEELSASNGHRVNAVFYSRLAEPLDNKQLVKDHWKDHGVQILHESILDELLAKATSEHRPVSGVEERPSV